MIKFESTEVTGWEHAIRGMRNPLNSWNKSDSGWFFTPQKHELLCVQQDKQSAAGFYIGPRDQDLMKRLRNAGTDHRKFMRMIVVYVDITAPLYWWKEFDTYKVGTVANSCSTMHTIHKKAFDESDFSMEHLIDGPDGSLRFMYTCIYMLNMYRDLYLDTKNKDYWWQLIQLLPTSYNQKRTIVLNYEVLANIYKSRKDHKLDEWNDFCDWIKTLTYSELIVGESSKKNSTRVELQEKYSLPSKEEINKLFNEVMRVDRRVRSYRVYDKLDMKILDFYDSDHKSLYAVDLYRTTLNEALAFIKEEIIKLTQQNLEFGA